MRPSTFLAFRRQRDGYGPLPPRSHVLRYAVDRKARMLMIELFDLSDFSAAIDAFRQIPGDAMYRAALDICVDCRELRALPTIDAVCTLALTMVPESWVA